MRAGSLRAFVALVPLIGALNGCAQTRQLDGWLSQSEPRTWAAHTVEVAAATVASDIITDSPWWGYTFMMGAQVGWEVQEARLTDWDVPWWGTAMDLVAPAVTGFVLGRWLSGRKKKDDAAEPVFDAGEAATENGGEREAGPDNAPDEVRDGPPGSGNRARANGAAGLFAIHPSPLLSDPCGSTLGSRPRLGLTRPGLARPVPGVRTRCSTLWGRAQP